MQKYYDLVMTYMKVLKELSIEKILREENAEADELATLDANNKGDENTHEIGIYQYPSIDEGYLGLY
ncbi:hypothetical protein ['Camptotheca acuminata' phytoplasma]|uniref:hypothetical protein n=1 Tax='Camptotheca acuminata' phytoplasma TaxID=3239192 RepID=UPI00351A08D9